MARGGKRTGAGRKPGVLNGLRELITKNDYETALATLRYAMKQRNSNLRAAVDAAKFVVEQKSGKAPQSVELTGEGPSLLIRMDT